MNASPSLTSTTVNDRILKYKLIDNIISVVLPPDGVPESVLFNIIFKLNNIYFNNFNFYSVRWNKCPTLEAMGNFELLLDEELAAQDEKETTSNKYKNSNNKWK